MAIKKDFFKNNIIVYVCGEDYQKEAIKLIKTAEKKFERINYITLNKTYNELIILFKKEKIDIKKFSFIDAITNMEMPKTTKNCIYTCSPYMLTEMSIAITKDCINHKPELFIFDSLSSLLVYERGDTLVKFSHSIINFVRAHNTKIAFIIMNKDYNIPVMKDLDMFSDETIYRTIGGKNVKTKKR